VKVRAGGGHSSRMSHARTLAALVLAVTAAGCTHVRASQREKLASPAMQFEMDPVSDQQRDSVLEITEGSTFPSAGPGTAGAGCGCN
jgi:uncharacterized protein DUF4266